MDNKKKSLETAAEELGQELEIKRTFAARTGIGSLNVV